MAILKFIVGIFLVSLFFVNLYQLAEPMASSLIRDFGLNTSFRSIQHLFPALIVHIVLIGVFITSKLLFFRKSPVIQCEQNIEPRWTIGAFRLSHVVLLVTALILIVGLVNQSVQKGLEVWIAEWSMSWTNRPDDFFSLLGIVIPMTVVIIPVVEEMLFRVIGYSLLRKKLSIESSVYVTSFVFAWIHLYSPFSPDVVLFYNPINLPAGPLVLGLLTQWVWVHERSFVKIALIHGLCNLLPAVLFL